MPLMDKYVNGGLPLGFATTVFSFLESFIEFCLCVCCKCVRKKLTQTHRDCNDSCHWHAAKLEIGSFL